MLIKLFRNGERDRDREVKRKLNSVTRERERTGMQSKLKTHVDHFCRTSSAQCSNICEHISNSQYGASSNLIYLSLFGWIQLSTVKLLLLNESIQIKVILWTTSFHVYYMYVCVCYAQIQARVYVFFITLFSTI